ncbi:MAG: four-carbon acid sugar kinase family protein [Eubacteriales bacterium]|nr:four-carbon acid sugar kinase family protein [Eubacteriales bacterium]
MNLPVSILNCYPEPDIDVINKLLEEEVESDGTKIVVLDDDPTGVQTVHDVYVYTDWTEESIMDGFNGPNKVFYILTNSRGMTVEETTRVHKEIGANIAKVARKSGRRYIIMSRSDSTLRGHYPLETKILKDAMEHDGFRIDGEILTPFFKEGGRFTLGNIHYCQQGDELVPAADTEFAKDKTFGYSHSDITEYIEEKTGGEYKAKDVTCISIESLRNIELDKIEKQLLDVHDFGKVVVNVLDCCDIRVFAIALYRAMRKGKNFMFRTAASLVKVIGAFPDKDLLTKDELIPEPTTNGGVVVVGSHTGKTTAQLNHLLELDCVVPIEFNSNKVLDGDEAFYAEVDRCVALEEEVIKSGKTAVCFTCRKLLTVEGDSKEDALIRSVKISDGVQSLVGRLKVKPAFVIAKGGITSSDVGTKALAVKKARVLGQIRPGIPVWQTGAESTFPGVPYIIFPGNAGTEYSLKESVEILNGIK